MADRDSTREAKTEPAPEITAAQAARAGQKQVTEMLGTSPEAVTGVEPTELTAVVASLAPRRQV